MNSGDTAWILMSTALVLFMTLPGLAMFYAGLVRSKSVLSVMMHCFSIAALVSILWLVVGYSLSFGDSLGGIVGGFNRVFFAGMAADMMRGSIPAIVFAIFQMTFAIITPALIVGAYVERIKFSSVLILSSAWLILVYAPICHWVWGGGWLGELGVMDFAGWPGSSYDRRCIGLGHRRSTRQTDRLSWKTPTSAQSRHDRSGSRDALGGLVRIQRGQPTDG